MYDTPTEVLSLTITYGEVEPLPIPRKPTRAQITELQELLAQYPQVELTPAHYFAAGMYGRELFIPAETVVVGKIHRHEHLVMLMQGEATIYTDEGMERIIGPKVWTSSPGTKRALFTHTPCTFFTVHLNPTDTQDLIAIEADVIEPEANPLLGGPFAKELQGVYA